MPGKLQGRSGAEILSRRTQVPPLLSPRHSTETDLKRARRRSSALVVPTSFIFEEARFAAVRGPFFPFSLSSPPLLVFIPGARVSIVAVNLVIVERRSTAGHQSVVARGIHPRICRGCREFIADKTRRRSLTT